MSQDKDWRSIRGKITADELYIILLIFDRMDWQDIRSRKEAVHTIDAGLLTLAEASGNIGSCVCWGCDLCRIKLH